MMLLATVFVACSDDDDEKDDDKPTDKVKLVSKIVTSEQYSDETITYTVTFEYDNNGKITKVVDSSIEDGEEYTTTHTFKKEGSKFIATYNNGESDREDKVFEGKYNEKGLVIKGSCEGDCDYTNINYDNDNQLINTTGSIFNCIWSNGNITSIDQHGKTMYTYTDYENKSNIDLNFQIMMIWEYDMYETSYFGVKSKNLIATREEDNYTYSYEYTFDKDGYVTSVKQYEVENGQKELFITQTITYKE